MDNFIVFQAERDAGLEEILLNPANACIKAHSPLCKNYDREKTLASLKMNKSIASIGDEELYSINSLMVSVGWNLNDDVFLKQRMWAARKTPEDKPFNFMHKELDILGHVVGCYVIDNNGNILSDNINEEELPDEFHIIASSVIYKDWQNQEQQQRINEIIFDIETALASEKEEDMKWYVSMECGFRGFDYAIKDSNGKVNILERTEATSVLTKHLRAYGGNGLVNDYKVGRVPKNLSFSGLGLVNRPANPQSVIFNGVLSFREEQNSQVQELMETAMANEIDNNAEDALILEYKSKIEALEKDNNDLVEKVSNLEASLQAKNDEIVNLNTKVTETESKIAAAVEENNIKVKELTEKLEITEKSLAEIKAAELKANRVAKLVEKGLTKEDAEATVVKFENLNDDQFETIVAFVKVEVKAVETVKTEEEAGTAAASVIENATPSPAAALVADDKSAEEAAEKAKAELAEFVKNELSNKKNKKK